MRPFVTALLTFAGGKLYGRMLSPTAPRATEFQRRRQLEKFPLLTRLTYNALAEAMTPTSMIVDRAQLSQNRPKARIALDFEATHCITP